MMKFWNLIRCLPHRYARDCRGTAAIEFALISIGFITLIFGIVDVGRAIMAWNTFQQSLEVATRFVIVNEDATEDEITDLVAARMNAFTFTRGDIVLDVDNFTLSGVDFVEVSGTYAFRPLIVGLLPDSWETLELPANSRMPIP